MRSGRFPANSASVCLRFAKSRPQFCESCGANYKLISEMFSALQSTSGPVTDVVNSVQIDAQLAMLSFLKLVRNWPKNAVLNLALCCGAIWRHREKAKHRCITTIHPVYNCSKKILENLLPVWLYGLRTNLYIPSRFWTTDAKFDTCYQRYVATCGKNLYRCTSTISALNYCSRIFSEPSAIYTKWCAQTFPPIFGLFAIFDHNLANIMAPPSDKCENYVTT